MPSTHEQPRAPSSTTTMRLLTEESDSLCGIYAAFSELERAKATLDRRLSLIPNGKRDLGLARSTLLRLMEKILATVPVEKLTSLKRNMRYMHYRVYPVKPVSVPENETVVHSSDLSVLAQYAHQYACVGCDKDCNHCELGKALDNTLVQCRGFNESWTWIDPTKDYTDFDVMPKGENDHE